MVIKLAISLRLSSDSNCADIKHFEESTVEYSVPLLEELFKAGSLVLPSLEVLLVASNFELESLTRFAHRHSMTLFADVAKRCTPFWTMELDSRKRGEAAYLKAKCLFC